MGKVIDRTIAVLSVAATLLIGWVTLGATVDIAAWGGTPPKALEAKYIGPSDLFSLGVKPGEVLSVKIEKDGRALENVRVVQATLSNIGRSPILPSDMIEPLSLRAASPWTIVAVDNQSILGEALPRLAWAKVNDHEFRSEPSLINPDDTLWATVYLTWDGPGEPPAAEDVPVRWSARIANLRSITQAADPLSAAEQSAIPLEVRLWGWGIPVTLVSFGLYAWLTLLLLVKSGLVRPAAPHTLALVPLTAMLNVAAAEAGATYIFNVAPNYPVPVPGWANLPPLVLNVIMLGGLLWAAQRTGRRAAA